MEEREKIKRDAKKMNAQYKRSRQKEKEEL